MEGTITAPTDTAEDEARDALEQQQNDLDNSGPTRESIDAAHRANGTTPPPATGNVDPLPEPTDDDPIDLAAQGTISGEWEIVVGGNSPDATKVRMQGGALEIPEPDGGWKKGRVYKLEIVARNIGPDIKDTVDSETQQPTSTTVTHRLRIQGARLTADVTAQVDAAAAG